MKLETENAKLSKILASIRELEPRIWDLLNTAKCLEGCEFVIPDEFCASSSRYKIGFTPFGRIGYIVCGTSFAWGCDGEFRGKVPKENRSEVTKLANIAFDFLSGFDQFEKEFYEYIDATYAPSKV